MSGDADLDAAIRALVSPSGDEGAWRAREHAMGVLSADPVAAHERLEPLADDHDPPPAVLVALARLGAPEGVTILERVLRHASDPASVAAGQALAFHPMEEAREALEAALEDPRAQVVAAAILGLTQRFEAASIAPLRRTLTHPDPEIRARAAAALEELGG